MRERWGPVHLTVRPPRLGGNARMGVFATRSPFRPNGLGLSSVRLEGVSVDTDEGAVITVSGVLLDPPFHNGTLENILPIVDKCVAPGGIVICESETKLVLPAEVGGLQLKKQYKYGKVLLWKYVRPMADAAEEEGEA